MSNNVSKTIEVKKDIEFIGISTKPISFTVKKLPVGKVIDLLNSVEQLPKEVANLDKMAEDEILQNISTMIAATLPKFVNVIAKAIDDPQITQEVILTEFGFAEAFDTIFAILEVNNVYGIMQTLKKVQALMKPQVTAVAA